MSDKDCLFCKIIAGEIPSEKVYEDDTTYAFKDINPKAKVHVLVVPREHYANVAELAAAGEGLAAVDHLFGADDEFLGGFSHKGGRVQGSGFRLGGRTSRRGGTRSTYINNVEGTARGGSNGLPEP